MDGNSYSVSYAGNGKHRRTVPAAANYNYGATETVSGAGSLVRTGYTFTGWNTQADGSGTTYAPGDTLTMETAPVTLYAQWTVNSYSVSYDANEAAETFPHLPRRNGYGSAVIVLGNVGATPLSRTCYTL
jgi:uncharacterized repeat protein (TIGR02543 family)